MQSGEGPEPKRSRSAEIDAIDPPVDLECGGQAAGSAGEIEKAGGCSVLLHLLDAIDGFQRADQYAAPYSGNFARDIEHKMIAVAKIDVGMAASQKHRLIARRRPPKVMGGGIARGIGFGFDDAPSHSARRKLANDDLADQEARERDGSGRQFAASQAPNQNWLGGVRTDSGFFGNAVWTGAHGVHFTEFA